MSGNHSIEGRDAEVESGEKNNLIQMDTEEREAVDKFKENYPVMLHNDNISLEERRARLRKQKTMMRENNEDLDIDRQESMEQLQKVLADG